MPSKKFNRKVSQLINFLDFFIAIIQIVAIRSFNLDNLCRNCELREIIIIYGSVFSTIRLLFSYILLTGIRQRKPQYFLPRLFFCFVEWIILVYILTLTSGTSEEDKYNLFAIVALLFSIGMWFVICNQYFALRQEINTRINRDTQAMVNFTRYLGEYTLNRIESRIQNENQLPSAHQVSITVVRDNTNQNHIHQIQTPDINEMNINDIDNSHTIIVSSAMNNSIRYNINQIQIQQQDNPPTYDSLIDNSGLPSYDSIEIIDNKLNLFGWKL